MKILILGDIVGRPGRSFLKTHLNAYKLKNKIDCVIANGENAAGGSGITAKTADEILSSGVDAITLGDHVWDQMNFDREIEDLEKVCRPSNLPSSNPGRDFLVIEAKGLRIGIFTVLGRSYMKTNVLCPFETAGQMVENIQGKSDIIIAEIHAETTSEKVAMGWYLDGKASVVFGTHTHIPTADGRILTAGTAYQTDLGMTGPRRSVLGRDIDSCLGRFIDGMPRKCPVAQDDVGMQGCIVEFGTSGKFPKDIVKVDFRMDP